MPEKEYVSRHLAIDNQGPGSHTAGWSTMGHIYPLPDNEDDFESLCLRYYRRLWGRETLVLYAKRGEKQDGIDIIDQLGGTPFYAVQCKHHEPTKTIPPAEIKAEVKKAERSPHSISHYVIATTAKKTKQAQDTVLNLNKRAKRKFAVEIHFWEDICHQVSEFGRVHAELIVYGDTILASPPSATLSSDVSPISDDLAADEKYPDIHSLFGSRKIEVAQHEIERLPDPETTTGLSGDERYALLRLRAKLALEHCNFEEAGRLFHLAYSESPDLDQAKQNRVLAFELENNNDKAFDEANAFVAAGLRTPAVTALLVRNAGTPEQLEAHRALIDTFVDSDESLNIAIVHKQLEFGHFEEAQAAARRALAIDSNSAHAHYCIAITLHERAVRDSWKDRPQRLREALTHYATAEDCARRDNYFGLLPEILANCAAAKTLLQDHTAADDFREAVSIASRPDGYAQRAVAYFLHQQNFKSAWEIAEKLDRKTLASKYYSIAAEFYHADDDEKRGHVHEMAALAEKVWDQSLEARFRCVQWAIGLHDYELAKSVVPPSLENTHPLQAYVLEAWIQLEAGDTDRARELALKALDESLRDVPLPQIDALAHILVRIGDDRNALPLLEQLATPGVFDDECRRLLGCAERLERHDILLRLCSELRETNEQDDTIRRLELQLLCNYAPDKAFELSRKFIEDADEPSYFVAAKNCLAIRLERRNELDVDSSLLPKPSELLPNEAYLMVTPYVELRKSADALVFLYHQLRHFFNDEVAHGHYIWFVLSYGSQSGLCETPSAVAKESAVCLQDEDTNEKHWVIIEDESPDIARDEFASNSELVQLLLGKQTGDVICLPGRTIQPRTESICEIATKFTRLFQDCITSFQRRFPDSFALQRVHVGDGDEFDPSPIIESLKQRREHVKATLEDYDSSVWSIYSLARRLGVNELATVKGLAGQTEIFLKCSDESPEAFAESANQGIQAKELILDLSAIVSLSLLKAWDCIDELRTYVVSQSVVDTIAEWLHDLSKDKKQTSGYTSLSDDDKLNVYEVTTDEIEEERNELLEMQAMVSAKCMPKASLSMSESDPKKRTLYINALGRHAFESVLLARDHQAVLWTDDFALACLAKADYSVDRVWTQLALKVFTNGGHLSDKRYAELSAKLASWRYAKIVWDPETIIGAARIAKWAPKSWPLKQCIQLIADLHVHIVHRTQIVVQLLRLIRSSGRSPFEQTAVTQACLTALGNPRAVRSILHRLPAVFRFDDTSVEFMRIELEYWLKHH